MVKIGMQSWTCLSTGRSSIQGGQLAVQHVVAVHPVVLVSD